MNLIEEALKKEKKPTSEPPKHFFNNHNKPNGGRKKYVLLLALLALVIIGSAGTLWYLSNKYTSPPPPEIKHKGITIIREKEKLHRMHAQHIKYKRPLEVTVKTITQHKKNVAKITRKTKPNYTSTLNRAYSLLSNGNLRKALTIYKNLLLKNPNQIDALVNSGIIYQKLGYLRKSTKTLLRALKLSPNNPQVLNALGVTYLKLRNYKAAEQCFRKSNNAQGIINLGILSWKVGRYKEAMKELKEAVRMNPDSAYTHYYLGLYYEAFGKSSKAQKELAKAALLAQENGDYQLYQRISSYLK